MGQAFMRATRRQAGRHGSLRPDRSPHVKNHSPSVVVINKST